MTEADTCREFVTPALQQAGWNRAPHAIGEQHAITAGRIVLIGGKARRAKQRRADYILYHRRDFPIAVVEAKESGLPAENGVQQAREYAELLGLRFAYATNGRRIIEIDFTTGSEREVEAYPTPDELWNRLTQATGLTAAAQQPLLEPYNLTSGKIPRYYQDIAIRRVVEAIVSGEQRYLRPWRRARARPASALRLPGNSGTVAGIVAVNTVYQDPLPRRSQHSHRRSEGQGFHPFRRCTPQDHRCRSEPSTRYVLWHLSSADDGERGCVSPHSPRFF